MNRLENEIFYALLRKSLFGTPIDYSTWEIGKWEWKPIIKTVEDHYLYTLFMEPLTALPSQLQPTYDVMDMLGQLTAMNMQNHIRLNADICTVFNLLTQNGFHPVLMKGQANATFYPKPLLRITGDIDIYIGKKDYKAASELLLTQLPNTRLAEDSKKHIAIFSGKTEIEVHQYAEIIDYPQHNKAYQKLVDYWFSQPDNVTIGGQQIPTVPHQFLPIYLFNHLWHHFRIGGVGLRQFCDVAMALHRLHGQLDLERMKQDLNAIGLFNEWQIGGGLIVDLIGLPKEEYPFYKEKDAKQIWTFSDLIVTDGNFAQNRYKDFNKSFFKHLTSSCADHIDRAKHMYIVSPSLASSYVIQKLSTGIHRILQGKWTKKKKV